MNQCHYAAVHFLSFFSCTLNCAHLMLACYVKISQNFSAIMCLCMYTSVFTFPCKMLKRDSWMYSRIVIFKAGQNGRILIITNCFFLFFYNYSMIRCIVPQTYSLQITDLSAYEYFMCPSHARNALRLNALDRLSLFSALFCSLCGIILTYLL